MFPRGDKWFAIGQQPLGQAVILYSVGNEMPQTVFVNQAYHSWVVEHRDGVYLPE